MENLVKLNRKEFRCVLVIGTIIALRLLGIFLIIPVFSIYAINYEGATISSAGVAFGIYALTQSLLQIPLGMMSDKFGRKPVILLGLAVFCAGSVLCGFADNIWELVMTRAIQGSGAIGAVAIAALGDSTRNEVRAQSFMFTGIIVGAAFIISLVIGPVLAVEFGFESLFFILAVLGAVAACVTVFLFPEPLNKKTGNRKEVVLKLLDPEIKKIFSSTFVISLTLNLVLFIYPLDWSSLGTGPGELWLIYLVILTPSTLAVQAFIRISERKKALGRTTRIGFFLLLTAFSIYMFRGTDRLTLYLAGGVFFVGHSIFQSILPAYMTQRVSSENRGLFSGFFNLANFMGACIGGMSAGVLYETHKSLPLLFGLIFIIIMKMVGLPSSPSADKEQKR